ncbi:hypothetical protein [Streptomyces litchfieldiae]|uniref:Uncharacterized protein n=1 Tax=Streptomyces litchfieldiae TaxID=3075543 RepID=A0ABU2MNJ0_9ACTN|nr:hypothetical protein [Streptomyces sp. DSM 44938]MDT0343190.1 hypothetical protein [Streptomyces sp. DSM 44938]
MRDAYTRRRDRLREHQRTREQQRRRERDARRQRENSPASKDDRLRRVVARIRRRITRMLRAGVRGGILRGALAAMRVWYRLSQLAVQGADRFQIHARLNPGTVVVGGVTVGEEEILRFVRQVASEILEADKTRRGADDIGRRQRTEKRVMNQATGTVEDVPVYPLRRGVSLASLLRYAKDRLPYQPGSKEIISLPGGQEVRRQQWWKPIRELPPEVNKLVYEMRDRKRVGAPLKYDELAQLLKAAGQGGKFRARLLARQIQRAMRGRPVRGPGATHAAFHAVLMVVQEGHRDPGSSPLVTSAMAMQIMARTGDVDQSLGIFRLGSAVLSLVCSGLPTMWNARGAGRRFWGRMASPSGQGGRRRSGGAWWSAGEAFGERPQAETRRMRTRRSAGRQARFDNSWKGWPAKQREARVRWITPSR